MKKMVNEYQGALRLLPECQPDTFEIPPRYRAESPTLGPIQSQLLLNRHEIKRCAWFLGELTNIGVVRQQPSLVRDQGLTINSVFDVISISRIFTTLRLSALAPSFQRVISGASETYSPDIRQ